MKTLKCPECTYAGSFSYSSTVNINGDLSVRKDGVLDYEINEDYTSFENPTIVRCPGCDFELEEPYEQYIINKSEDTN